MTFSQKDTAKCKGFAILIMLFHHLYADTGRFSDLSIDFWPLSQNTAVQIANFMKICVGIYVFLSAYGLTLSYRKWDKGDGKFFLFRYLKMMFPFFAVYILLAVCSLFIPSNWTLTTAYGLQENAHFGAYCSMGLAMLVDFLGLAHLFGMPTFNATWWYMSLAIVIIALIPVLCRGVKKLGGFYAAILAAIVPFALGLPTVSLPRYFLCMVLGVIVAQKDGLAKSKEYYVNLSAGKKWLAWAAMTALLILCVVLRQGRYKGTLVELWDSLIPVLVIVYLYWFVNDMPVVGKILGFFGKYSTTIFLTHTFIRYYWLRSVSYHFSCAWLNFVTLTVLSTAAAMAIDGLLKLVRYQHFTDSLTKKITGI